MHYVIVTSKSSNIYNYFFKSVFGYIILMRECILLKKFKLIWIKFIVWIKNKKNS